MRSILLTVLAPSPSDRCASERLGERGLFNCRLPIADGRLKTLLSPTLWPEYRGEGVWGVLLQGVVCLLLVISSISQAQTTALSSPAIQKPTGPVDPASCVTAECHAEVKDYAVVHGPVNVNACDACHKPVDVQQHTFEYSRDKTELCTFCHQLDLSSQPVVHKPLAEGQCLSCHNPHGGKTQRFIRGQSTAELCNSCHASVVGEKKFVHGPVAAGACDSCHTSHTSEFPKLLNVERKDVCLTCHADMKNQMAKVKFPHKAVEQDCMGCHDPHASDFTMQIKQKPVDLCVSCHEPVKQDAMNAKYKHSVVTAGEKACINCHTAHGSDLADLMRNDPVKICMGCHDKPVEAEGRTVAALADVMDPNSVKHGPIRDGNCSGCHKTHGSDHSRLLVQEYPATFYQPFALEKFALCFTCHDKQLVQAPTAQGLTGFRNGELNLHYMHVNKEKGRNCRACHNAHASPNELHVRDSVPYGNWNMPINFKKTDTGGSCSPGCHKPFTYDREKPVSYEAAPTTQSASISLEGK